MSLTTSLRYAVKVQWDNLLCVRCKHKKIVHGFQLNIICTQSVKTHGAFILIQRKPYNINTGNIHSIYTKTLPMKTPCINIKSSVLPTLYSNYLKT